MRAMEEEAALHFKRGETVKAVATMQALIQFSLELEEFDWLASLEIVILFLYELTKTSFKTDALGLLREVSKVSKVKKNNLTKSEVEIYHHLPVLFNRMGKYSEAVKNA